MQVHHCRTAEHLVERLVTLWSGPRQDPFAFDLAVVPGPGFQRWLSQQLATAGDAPGICAGVEFTSFDALERRLGGADDPWRPGRLAWLVQQVALASTGPELEVLRTHLAASRESWSASRRIAGKPNADSKASRRVVDQNASRRRSYTSKARNQSGSRE